MTITSTFPDWQPDLTELDLTIDISSYDAIEKGLDIGLQFAEVPQPRICLPRNHLDCLNINLLENYPLLDDFARALSKDHDFRLIRIPCSIKPTEKTTIVFAKLTVTFGHNNKKCPEVYSIYPKEILHPMVGKTEAGIDPSLSIKNIAEIKIGRVVRAFETNQFIPGIKGYYSHNVVEWELYPIGTDGVWGIKEFFVLLKWHKPAFPVPVSIQISARVKVSMVGVVLGSSSYTYSQYDPRLCG